jgi:Na+/H+-dicarboxylate symporter
MSTQKKFTIPKGYRLPLLLLLCIVAGSLLGLAMGEKILWIKPIGTIFVNLCFTIAVPVVFFSITSSVARIESVGRLGKILRNTIFVFVGTGIVAGILMIVYMKIVPPGKGIENIVAISDSQISEFSWGDRIVSTLTVTDFPDLFSRTHMLPLIIASLLVGGILSGMGEKAEPVRVVLDVFADLCMTVVQLIMKWVAPIGLLAYFAALIAELGPQLLGTYARVTLLIYYPIGLVYFFSSNFIYTYIAGGMKAVKAFFGRIFSVAVTAFGTQSSLAALPGNLEVAREIGVPKDIRSVVLPLGATAHMDGAVMSNLLKIAMMFALTGRSFTGIGNYASSILLCVMCGVVTSAIPGSGMIGAVMIMSFFDFPYEFFPIIASLTFLVDPMATTINCVGDCTSSMIVTRLMEGKDWMEQKLTANEEKE